MSESTLHKIKIVKFIEYKLLPNIRGGEHKYIRRVAFE
jgi:hypothetical protein